MRKKILIRAAIALCALGLIWPALYPAQKEEVQKVSHEIVKRARRITGKDRLDGVLAGRTKVLDLTYPLNAQTPYWPAPGYEPFHFEFFTSMDKEHVLSGKYCTPEHLGTHVDAPNHFEQHGVSVDKMALDDLFGYAVVINVRGKAAANPDYRISPADIQDWERRNHEIQDGSIVLAYTGWGERVGSPERYQNKDSRGVMHFPGWSTEALDFLLRARNINAIGIDTLSIDYGPSTDFAVHHKLMSAGKYGIENVAHLEQMPPRGAFLIVSPIDIQGGSGGQARIFALIE
ncbi:MAG: cyclase family protein [Acidobacteriia bacterium]|nr:cyclase family protein [Terriglobia bacterium]